MNNYLTTMDNFLFIIGVEGSGHSMIRSYLHPYLSTLKDIEHHKELATRGSYTTASFPYGQPRNTKRRIDIKDLYRKMHSLHIPIKTIKLCRDPRYATLSSVRRGFADIHTQAHIVLDNLCYINESLRNIEHFPVYFNEITKDPQSYVEPLSKYLNIDPSMIDTQSMKPYNKDLGKYVTFLSEFFKEHIYDYHT